MGRATRGSLKKVVKRLSWERVVEEFMLNQGAQGLSKRTLDDYRYHIDLFFTRMGLEDDDFDNETIKHTVRLYFSQSSQGSPYTFNTRRKKLKTFFQWVVTEGMIESNPLASVKKMKEDTDLG